MAGCGGVLVGVCLRCAGGGGGFFGARMQSDASRAPPAGYLTRIECSNRTEEGTMNKKLLAGLALTAWAVASTAAAEKIYGPGASDTEIKIGNTNPYSGNASAYGGNGRAEAAY